ncbi:MAG: hypothetical protein CMO44_00875 [Verrucomicrobiales bacterium]|nr:hypothetical protein [Verrucomicrobiales bacterium]|tara:strand:+ start:9920 stop:10132 length:213 start_codon:yes stop_codon:yes gene_type:complete
MKDFSQLRELTGRKPKGRKVYDKKIKGISVMVHKDQNRFVTYVDGDRLDVYRSQREAEKAGLEFIKQYKG